MSAELEDAAEPDAQPAYRLVVGECRIEVTGEEQFTQRGQVVVLVKPDRTVLVHDVSGYKPVAWITRGDSVSTDRDTNVITAVDGDHWLRIDVEQSIIDRQFPGSPAGEPTTNCPDCGGPLVVRRDEIHCIACHERYGLPSDAMLIDEKCSCGLPKMRVDRGETFELCVDRTCEPLDERIADRFDGVWDCPETDCDGSLRVLRRGGLLLGCDQYPDCETAFRFPAGTLSGNCTCGLPRFSRDGESHCLDVSCQADR